ncbi:MAG: DUF2254 domain-containing protein [Acidimicrobiales bacterium]
MPRTVAAGARGGLWLIPVTCVIAGVALSIGTMWIDRASDFELVPGWLTGGPDAALGILTTIAISMVSLATLVLTITMVVVQLAMGQFSPRIVQTFLRDRPSQLAIGLFVATFAHAMLAMREVRFESDGQVPGVAVVVAYVLVLTSIAMLVLYVHHIGRSLRVSALIELVGSDTRRQLDRWYPEEISETVPDSSVVAAEQSGVLVGIDRRALVRLATEAGCSLRVVVAVGAFVPAGAPLLVVEGVGRGLDPEAVLEALTFGLERTMDEDVAYGFRMLVDMGERALSEGPFLDPTTAVQAVDRLHDGLRQLARRRLPDGRHHDERGVCRLVIPTMAWDDYVHLAFDEIRMAGSASPQVSRRLLAALDDLLEVAPEERRPPLEEQRELLSEAINSLDRDRRDRARAVSPDALGLGATVP